MLCSKSVTIAARVEADLDSALERLASATGRSKSWLINEALRSYIANEQQFLAAVDEGKQALLNGKILDHAAVVGASNGSSTAEHDDPLDPTSE